MQKSALIDSIFFTNLVNLSHYFVVFQGFKVAYVVFKSAASVQKAKKMSYKETRILSTEKHTLLTGMESEYLCSTLYP